MTSDPHGPLVSVVPSGMDELPLQAPTTTSHLPHSLPQSLRRSPPTDLSPEARSKAKPPSSPRALTQASPSSSPQPQAQARDPLRQFGILVPAPLRAAQAAFARAGREQLLQLVVVMRRLRELEDEVQSARGIAERTGVDVAGGEDGIDAKMYGNDVWGSGSDEGDVNGTNDRIAGEGSVDALSIKVRGLEAR
jgi:hypothetical protein